MVVGVVGGCCLWCCCPLGRVVCDVVVGAAGVGVGVAGVGVEKYALRFPRAPIFTIGERPASCPASVLQCPAPVFYNRQVSCRCLAESCNVLLPFSTVVECPASCPASVLQCPAPIFYNS